MGSASFSQTQPAQSEHGDAWKQDNNNDNLVADDNIDEDEQPNNMPFNVSEFPQQEMGMLRRTFVLPCTSSRQSPVRIT